MSVEDACRPKLPVVIDRVLEVCRRATMPPMMELAINGRALDAGSAQAFDAALNGANAEPEFELWATIPDGPSLCMLRNGSNAWLMYLRYPGDTGLRSCGAETSGAVHYTLSNGQVDECPRAWCIDVSTCLLISNDSQPAG